MTEVCSPPVDVICRPLHGLEMWASRSPGWKPGAIVFWRATHALIQMGLLAGRAREITAGSLVLAALCGLYYVFGLPH